MDERTIDAEALRRIRNAAEAVFSVFPELRNGGISRDLTDLCDEVERLHAAQNDADMVFDEPAPNGELVGDSVAAITYALERPANMDEWARLLRDARAVIERLDDALTEAKRQRNEEQRLRLLAERS